MILQASAVPGEVAVFFSKRQVERPAGLSTLGMRLQNEQSGSTSLFAQPVAIKPIPETAGVRIEESGISLDYPAEMEPKPEANSSETSPFEIPLKKPRR